MCRTVLLGLILVAVFAVAPAAAVELARQGRSDYRIVIADAPEPSVRAAATELADHLHEVTGATFPVVCAAEVEGDRLILVGPSAALDRLALDIDWRALEPEGFVLRTVGRKLVVAGPGRGTLNGVYTFLEEAVGCQWYMSDLAVIPSRPDLEVPDLAVRYVPPFESRLILSGSAFDVDWAARQRLNTFTRDVGLVTKPDGTQSHLGEFISDPRLAGAFHYAVWHVHTLSHNMLLPHAAYDEHPDFFALQGGQRRRQGQACLGNPRLAVFIAKRAAEWIRSDPEAPIISVSAGDFAADCQCPLCQAEYKQHGLAGTYMRFVNRVAAELEREFPDVLVDTLAYHGTRVLPPGIKMRPNVVVRYCTQESETCYYHALDQCPLNQRMGILENMRAWVQAAPRVWVWYYVLPRTELLPFPHLRSLGRNFRLMRDTGVKGQFIQAIMAPAARHGGAKELEAYLFAKLLWNPDYDVQAGVQRFVNACYGPAAEHILHYIDTVNAESSYAGGYSATARTEVTYGPKDQLHAIYGGNLSLKRQVIEDLDARFDLAEQAVIDDPATLQRVKHVRLALQLYLLYYSDADDPLRTKALGSFFPVARHAGLQRVYVQEAEKFMTLDEFRDFCEQDAE